MDKIYTRIGPTLISINPYKKVSLLNDENVKILMD